MAEHDRTTRKNHDEVDEKHRTRHQESQPSFDQSLAWDTGPFSISETPFYPRMDEHAAILSGIPFAVQRHEFVMRLHQTYGTGYVQRLMEAMKAQAKLTVSQPDDVYEQEADRIADIVMQKISASEIQRQTPEEEEEIETKPANSLQRQTPEEEEEEIETKPASSLQRQTPEEEEEIETKPASSLQRQTPEEEEINIQKRAADSGQSSVSGEAETRINNALGSGQPLSDTVREPMERAFGNDFSGVRVHTDSEAGVLNQHLGARAFTTGRDIFFREGEYSPDSGSGQRLIAHELTHVVQQKYGKKSLHMLSKNQYGKPRSIPVQVGTITGYTGKLTIQRDETTLKALYKDNSILEIVSNLKIKGVPAGQAWLYAGVLYAYTAGNDKIPSVILKNIKDIEGYNAEDASAVDGFRNWRSVLEYGYQKNKGLVEENAKLESVSEILNAAVEALPEYNAPKYVTKPKQSKKVTPQRAVEADDLNIADYKEGNNWTAPSVMSFSWAAPKGEYAVRKYRMHITGAGALRSIGKLNKEQMELIVPAGTKFIITAVYNSKNKKTRDKSPIVHIFLQPIK